MCSTRVARKVTYDDRAAPHSPFFWCEECFMLMHYDQQVSTEEHSISVGMFGCMALAGLAAMHVR